MVNTGALKASITSAAGLTLGEDRTVRFVVKDSAGVNVSDFTGWTFGWYLLPRQNMATNDPDVLLTKTSASGISATAPNVDVSLDPVDTDDLSARTYFYELWRTDAADVVRLAYGPIVFID